MNISRAQFLAMAASLPVLLAACGRDAADAEPVPFQPDAGTDAATTTPTTQGGSDVGVFNFDTRTVMLNSGYALPLNGLGTYSLHGEECVSSVRAAIDAGVRLFDTASAYGNEEEVGQAVRAAIDEGVVTREELFVTTKIYPGSEMADPEPAIQACIDRLDIGYVDLMLLHHPDRNDVLAYQAMERFVDAVIPWDTDLPMTQVQNKMVSLISDNYKKIYSICSKDKDEAEKLYLRLLLVTDYICGMTDSYAKDLYQELNGIV